MPCVDAEVTELAEQRRSHLSLVHGEQRAAPRPTPNKTRNPSLRAGATGPVLYINGDCDNRIILRRISRRWRTARLLVADGGRAGMRTVVGHEPRLILLDAHLPDCLSLDVMTRIRQAAPLVPVVVLSNSPDPQEETRFVRAGASAYVTKPLNVVQFDATVMMLLESGALR